MSYQFQPTKMYRMPTHFGPRTGPRAGAEGRKFDCRDNPKATAYSVSFLTQPAQLEAMLPPGFILGANPVATVIYTYLTEIEWLAGRGYNTLGLTFPAIFQGERDCAGGQFLTVLWENLTDPIITGREELGFSKIYCELPPARVHAGGVHCTASWLGFKFMDLRLDNLSPQTPQEIEAIAQQQTGDGLLHYKYMPRTGQWGQADVAYVTLTPAHTPNRVIKERWVGQGQVQFHPARWEDMPTQFNIVNTFHALEIKEYLGASMTKTVGGKDLSDQRILA